MAFSADMSTDRQRLCDRQASSATKLSVETCPSENSTSKNALARKEKEVDLSSLHLSKKYLSSTTNTCLRSACVSEPTTSKGRKSKSAITGWSPTADYKLATGQKNDDTPTVIKSATTRKPLSKQVTPPSQFKYSNNSKSYVMSMCLTTENTLWVKYKPPSTQGELLRLFAEDGSELLELFDNVPAGESLTCVGDILLSPCDWQWVGPTGESGRLDNAPNDWALCSKSQPPHVILFDKITGQYSTHLMQVRSLFPLAVQLSLTCQKTGIELKSRPTAFDISADSAVFAFVVGPKIVVYVKSSKTGCLSPFSVMSLNDPRNYWYSGDICFWSSNNREILAVSHMKQKKYNRNCLEFILTGNDHKDGFEERRRFAIDGYGKLVTHPEGRLWLGAEGGIIRVF